jgi:hypothetical protein
MILNFALLAAFGLFIGLRCFVPVAIRVRASRRP